MTTSDKCPKCGAALHPPTGDYKCGSFHDYGATPPRESYFHQSDRCKVTELTAAREADAKELAELRAELKRRDDYDARVPDPRDHKYFNPGCSSGCEFLMQQHKIDKLTASDWVEAAAKEIYPKMYGLSPSIKSRQELAEAIAKHRDAAK